MCRFSKDRWLVARSKECKDAQHRWIVGKLVNEVITSDVQALDVKFDQEASIVDMKCTMMGEVRSVGGSSSVSQESPVGASAANAAVEKSVRVSGAHTPTVWRRRPPSRHRYRAVDMIVDRRV